MGITSLRALTALLVLGRSCAAAASTFGMMRDQVSVITNGLVTASETSSQSAHASIRDTVNFGWTEKEKRELTGCTTVHIENADNCGKDGCTVHVYNTDDCGKDGCTVKVYNTDNCGKDGCTFRICNTDNCGKDGWWDELCYEKCGEEGWWHPMCGDHIVYCNDDLDLEEATTITVTWTFVVETNSEDPSNLEAQVCDALEEIMVDTIDQNHCDTTTRRQRRLGGARLLEIQGYSEEMTCKNIATCDGDSKTCNVYEATIDIVYDNTGDDNTDAEEVTDTVTAIAEEKLNDDGIKNTVNDGADDEGDEVVTNIAYGVPEEGVSGEKSYEQEQGLSKAEKAAIATASILLLLLLILFCLWRRHMRRRQEEALANKSVATQDTAVPGRGTDADDSSYKTCCLWRRHLRRRQQEALANKSVAVQDTAVPGRGTDADDSSYKTSDYNNLGMYHSKLDVHRCASGTCEVCNPTQNNPPGVSFVRSKDSGPPGVDR